MLDGLGVLTRRCLRKTAHSEPAVTMLPTRKRAGEDDRHGHPSRRSAATPQYVRSRRQSGLVAYGLETSKIPAAVNSRGPRSPGAGSRTGNATFWGHSAWRIGQKHHAIVNYFFFPVTSSHFSPSSVLILSTFTQASSFICRNTARPAA